MAIRALLVLCLLFAAGCARQQMQTVAASAPESTPVAVAKASRTPLAREVELTGEFRAYQETELHAKVAGYLREIRVDVGDVVSQGQTLAMLEVPELDEELTHAAATEKRSQIDVGRSEGDLARAESALRLRQISYERISSVAKSRPNLVAQQEIDDAAARYEEAKAQVQAAKATLEASREQVHVTAATRSRVNTMMRYLRITAPFSGMITRRYADPGAMIQAGTASQSQARPVVRLAQVDKLRLILPVPESIVARIRPGLPVEARVDSVSELVHGKVSRITGELHAATRTMLAEVDVPNQQGRLKPGMFAKATVVLETRIDALTVPLQSLQRDESESRGWLWVVTPQRTLEKRQLQLGMQTAEQAEVLAGLNEGELVVLAGSASLRAGQAVNPKENAVSTQVR